MGVLNENGPHEIDAALNLLDRQIVDKDGRMAGTIDDLELTEDPKGAPYVTAILAGPGALSRQLGGRFGKWLESVHERLHPDQQPGPPRIAFGVVRKIDNHVEVIVSREELEISLFEDWARDRFIKRIPGAEHEAE
jgi:sporulation protein YlmC with PRC-barrel domain